MKTELPLSKTPGRHPDWGMDGLVMGSLFVLCSLGIWALSTPTTHGPEITAERTEPVDTGADETVLSSTTTAPATPTKTASRLLVPPQKTINIGPAFELNTPLSRAPKMYNVKPQIPTAKGFITVLGDAHNDAFFLRSNHRNINGFWGGDWNERNVKNTAEGASLDIRQETRGPSPFTMAEMKSREHYGYGRYEVVMRPARGGGIVSSFFTYTGPYENRPHDEVDIEFLGMDTSRIHFNYFKNGKRGEPATFDLPFDAADAHNHYAFEWRADGITWFVNGTPYYSTEADDRLVPRTPSRVMFNVWTGKPRMQSWHGKPDFGNQQTAHYACVSFTPLGEETRACSDLYLPDRPFKGRGLQASMDTLPTR